MDIVLLLPYLQKRGSYFTTGDEYELNHLPNPVHRANKFLDIMMRLVSGTSPILPDLLLSLLDSYEASDGGEAHHKHWTFVQMLLNAGMYTCMCICMKTLPLNVNPDYNMCYDLRKEPHFAQEFNCQYRHAFKKRHLYTVLKLQKHVSLVWKVVLVSLKLHSKAWTEPLAQQLIYILCTKWVVFLDPITY